MNFKKILIILLLFTLFLPNIGWKEIHAGGDKKIIKVGFPIQEGLTEKDENGNYTGYTVDYLKEIKKYTNWDYEFVEVEGDINEQLITLLEMLQKGEIDLLGSMNYSDALAQIYDYPSYHYGLTYTGLFVRKDDDRFIGSMSNWNGMTVGIYPALKKREQELREFAKLNGFSYNLVEYDTYEELMEAINNGSVDATVLVDISLPKGLKSIVKFIPVPFYFATTKGNSDIISELNNALFLINKVSPHFMADLDAKYYSVSTEFTISEENKKYIESLGTVNVLMFRGNAPIQYIDGEPKGISVSFLEAFKEATGLQYEIFVAIDYEEYKKIIESNEIDLVLGVPTVSNQIEDIDLTLSLAYITNPFVKVSNSSNTDTDEITNISENEVHNTLSILEQINANKNIVAYLDLYSVNYYLQQPNKFKHLRIDSSEVHNISYAIGLADNDKANLLAIINNFISSLSSEQIQQMIYENSNVEVDYTVVDFIRLYYLQLCVFVLVLLLLLLLIYLRMKLSHHKELALQINRFNELSHLIKECIFEYDYEKDLLKVQNNVIMFDQLNEIQQFSKYEKFNCLKEMIKNKQDASHDFLFEVKGEQRWFRIKFKVIRDRYNKVNYALGKIYDVNDEIQKEKTLIESSRRDPLTDLLNRKGAEERITTMLNHDCTLGTMILLDVDHFKSINDNLGHLVGDQLLKEISNLINSFFRENDVKCRLGGDEFIIFIHAIMPEEVLKNKLNYFIKEANEQIFKKYQNYKLSFSIGAIIVSESTNTYKELYRKADEAMYKAKMNGKNGYFIDRPSNL